MARGRGKTLKELLGDVLTAEELALLPRSYDIIGDIAMIKLPEELMSKARLVGEALKRLHPFLRSVVTPVEKTSEVYRVRKVKVVWGDENTETVHKEHGCLFKVDLNKVFFNPRLSHERLRIAKQVRPGEVVLNCFAGVGTASIIIARVQPRVKVVYSVDINPDAYRYMVENIRLNKVEDKVVPILGDVREVVRDKLEGVADRVIMLLPAYARDFLDVAVKSLKPSGGVIHYYDEVGGRGLKKQDLLNLALKRALEVLASFGKEVKVLGGRVVRAVRPFTYHVALDLYVS